MIQIDQEKKLLVWAMLYGPHIAHVLEWRDRNAKEYIQHHLLPYQEKQVQDGYRLGDNIGLANTTKSIEKAISAAEKIVENSVEWHAQWGYGCLTKNNGKLYLYRHTHFFELDKNWIEHLLKTAGLKYGLSIHETRSYNFFESFEKQLIYSASFPPEIEEDRVEINLLNGIFKVDSEGNMLFAERKEMDKPKQWFTYTLPFMYEKEATAKQWLEFLDQVLPEKEAQMVLHEYLACVFFPNSFIKIEKALFLVGGGSNGKSVVFDVVKRMYGSENVSSVGLEKLNGRFQMQLLEGKLLNYASEIGKKFDPTLFKQLTSQESEYVEKKGKDPRNIKGNIPRLMFNGNHKPISEERSNAIYRRLIFLPFNVTIAEEDQDKELSQKLYHELSGIFNLVIEGLDRVIKNKGFTKSALIEAESIEYKDTMDSVAAWVKDVQLIADESDQYHSQTLYEDSYCRWCIDNDMSTMSRADWRKAMINEGFKRKKLTRGHHKGSAGWAVRLPLTVAHSSEC